MKNLITEHLDIWTAAQTPKTNGGRGNGHNSNGQDNYGIKKLRELILELAVRGKLVPQDPEDEPASVLLEKIAKEKEKLLIEGKIKKQRALPEITEDEKPYELPSGWEWKRLTDVYYSISPSGKKILSSEIIEEGKFPVVDQGKSYVAGYTDDPSLLIEIPGPVIVFGDHTTERKYIDFDFVAGADGTKILRPYKMDERFFYIYITSYEIESRGYARHFKLLNDKLIAIPPLSEQRRIVAKVDELMTLCDKLEQQQSDNDATHQTLVENPLTALTNATDQKEFEKTWEFIADHFDILFTTEESIDQLKQTILQLAVMGKLVPQEPMDLPAPHSGKFFVYALECEDKSIYIGQTGNILKRWKEHATGQVADWTKKHPPVRLVHWEEYNSREEAAKREKEFKTGFGRKWLKREFAAGRTRQAGEPASILLEKIAKEKERLIKAGKIKKQKSLPPISDDEKPYELPKGWEWKRLTDVYYSISPSGKKILSSKIIEEGKFPVVDQGKSYIAGYTDDASLLIEIPGPVIVFGDHTTERKYINFNFVAGADGTKILRPYKMDERYFYIYIMSYEIESRGYARHFKLLNDKLIAIPPLSEQHRIVAKVDELMTLCETLKTQLNDTQTTQIQLADSIIEKAVL